MSCSLLFVLLFTIWQCSADTLWCGYQTDCGPCSSNTQCDLNCNQNNQCQNSQLRCGDAQTCAVTCTEPFAMTCAGATITATNTVDLSVDCQFVDSCLATNVICGTGDCTITCKHDSSCQNMIVDATNVAGNLQINCLHTEACAGITVDCGPGDCYINCVSDAGGDHCNSMKLTCGVGTCRINCNDAGYAQCESITVDTTLAKSFECYGDTQECLAAPAPFTAYPTLSPIITSAPTTDVSTTDVPTNYPITAGPTDTAPSVSPTDIPSANPAERTTVNPTMRPITTLSPTKPPTQEGEAPDTSMDPTHGKSMRTISGQESVDALVIVIIILVLIICLIGVIYVFRRFKIREKYNMRPNNSMVSSVSSVEMGQSIKSENGEGEAAHITTQGGDCESDNDMEVFHDGNDANDESDGFYAKAMLNYQARDEDQLDLNENGLFYIMNTLESGWWFGLNEVGNDGWMPSNYLRKCDAEEVQQIKHEQRKKTDIGDLLAKKMDNHLVNVDKYLDIVLPPQIKQEIGLVTENAADISASDSDSDDIMYTKNSTVETKGGTNKE